MFAASNPTSKALLDIAEHILGNYAATMDEYKMHMSTPCSAPAQILLLKMSRNWNPHPSRHPIAGFAFL